MPTGPHPAPESLAAGAGPWHEGLMTGILHRLRPAGLAAICLAALTACTEASAPEARLPTSPVARCINLSNALEAPAEGDWGYRIEAHHLSAIAAAGFDTVRLPVRVSAHAQAAPPHTIDPALLARLDAVIGAALDAGLQVILDVHHYHEINAAPDIHEPRLEAIWAQLAAHYHGAPDGLLFELINEPHSAMTVARTDRLNRRLIARIREIDPERWIVAGSAGWGALDAWLTSDPPEGPGLLSTFHYYDPFDFTHQGAAFLDEPPPTGKSWGSERDLAALERAMAKAAAKGAREGVPVFMGEFGVYREVALDQRAAWTRAVRVAAERHGIGWCHWGFAADFRAYDTAGEAWIPPVLDALIGE